MSDEDVKTLDGSASIAPNQAIDTFLAESGTPTRADAPAGPRSATAVGAERSATRVDRKTATRLRARKVRRILRHVEPWSVLKMSLILYFCMWIIIVVAGAALWSLAVNSGTIDNFESFLSDVLALETFEFDGGDIFEAASIGGLILVIALTGFNVLVAVLFNLISDLTGGVRVTVVEEETARYMDRRPRRADAATQEVEATPRHASQQRSAPPQQPTQPPTLSDSSRG
ncbi:MAG: DUF3566 domain-containing protein [Acidobacteria bacterium]|nr:DUF3566 domain-containing protein [Acidobacteriota bacterium]